MSEETELNDIFAKKSYIYGIGSTSDTVFAERCREKLLTLPNLKNNPNVAFFHAYEMTEEERAQLLTLSHIVICYGSWREDPICCEEYQQAKSLKKNCFEINNSRYEGWSMLAL